MNTQKLKTQRTKMGQKTNKNTQKNIFKKTKKKRNEKRDWNETNVCFRDHLRNGNDLPRARENEMVNWPDAHE